MQFIWMARVKMTAREIDEGDAGTSARGTSTPVTRSASKKKTPVKRKIPSKKVDRSKTAAHVPAFDRPTVDNHLLFGASIVTRRDFEKYSDRGYLDDPECCRPGGSDITPTPKSDEIVLFEDFLLQGLRLPISDFVAEVLECFEVFFSSSHTGHLPLDECLRMGFG